MKQTYIALAALTAILCGNAAYAQTLKSGYFLDGYLYKHQMNPAFANEQTYFGFPGFGNFNVNISSNVGLSTFLYDSPDPRYDLTTFLDRTVSSGEFLGNLKKNNRLGMGLSESILSFGMKGLGGYITFDFGVKAQLNATLPKDLFMLLKDGMNTDGVTDYHFNRMGINSKIYAEMALGYSRQLTEQWRVGGKVKFLIAGIYAQATYDKMDVRLSGEKWEIDADGRADIAVKGMNLIYEETDGRQEVNDVDFGGGYGPAGGGLAFDLGATYQAIEGLEVSASILDFGFLTWNNLHRLRAKDGFSFDGFENLSSDSEDSSNSIDDQLDDLGNDLQDVFRFVKEKENAKETHMLAATLNLGARYAMPFYRSSQSAFYLPRE